MQRSQKTDVLKDPAPKDTGQDDIGAADMSLGRPKDTPAPTPITDWAGL